MRVDIQRLDERIKKLQEVRRILSDADTEAILKEFLLADNETNKPALPAEVDMKCPPMPSEEASDLVKEVVNGGDAHSGGIWRRRG